ncbi:hypothetical protein BOTNAR_0036g00130 [Botryotinia narcissicola]|uniref:Uncharacterized protein n=1 Tax=Botryotinia narcissicola TaxID=278944 RepID=A0A4Z1J272_9HELO|nr:hypothetical protein BOTNAR_0036g00130 [Botryotinia narcissicola]
MPTPYYALPRRPRFFRTEVFFGREATGGYEYSWTERWWVYTEISYRSFVRMCNRSLMERHPNTDLREFRLILNVSSDTYDKITPTNIRAVMRDLQSNRGSRIIFPAYIKRRHLVVDSNNGSVRMEGPVS